MTSKRFWQALAAITFSVGVAACGSGGGTPSAAAAASATGAGATPEPASGSPAITAGCSLLTASDVTTAIGQPMTDTTSIATLCTFDSVDHVKGLAVFTYADRNAMALSLQTGGDPVAGLGDEAYWLPNGTVFVRKGERGFSLLAPGSVSLTDPSVNDALKASLIGLAKIVLAKF